MADKSRSTVKFVLFFMLAACAGVWGCGPKAGMTGVVVDGGGKPLGHVKVLAVKDGGEKKSKPFSVKTGRDGSFGFEKLAPFTHYNLTIESENWTAGTVFQAGTGQEDTVVPLPMPLVLRFTKTPDGVIKDSITGLEWLTHGASPLDAFKAVRWARKQKTGGGGWHLPDKSELRKLISANLSGRCQLDPIFGLGDNCMVWTNPAGDPRYTKVVDFKGGGVLSRQSFSEGVCALAVRVAR